MSASLLELKLSTTINSSDAVMGSSQVINTPPWEWTALMMVTQRLVEGGCEVTGGSAVSLFQHV